MRSHAQLCHTGEGDIGSRCDACLFLREREKRGSRAFRIDFLINQRRLFSTNRGGRSLSSKRCRYRTG